MEALPKKTILGIAVTDASKERVLQYITKSLDTSGDSYYIVTPNPEMVVASERSTHHQRVLNQARIALPDGIGLVLAASLFGKPLQERISGTDFMEYLCKEVATPLRQGFEGRRKPITVGFLGGRNGVAEKTAECLVKKYPGLKVAFAAAEWGGAANGEWRMVNGKSIDILFVAFGFPKQEEWMAEHVGKIPVKVMMGVGGAFDYLSGEIPRAPLALREVGLEWLFRLAVQPWRIRRQLALFSFVSLVIKERLRGQS